MSSLSEVLEVLRKDIPKKDLGRGGKDNSGRPVGTPTQTLTGLRVCRDCGVEKHDSEFYFVTTKSRDGSKSWTYAKPECKECHNKVSKEWFSNNKEIAKKNSRAYYKANLFMADYWRAKAGAKKRGATLFMSVEDWEVLRQQRNCYHCSTELSFGITNIEHLIPLCEGGQHTVENVVLSCANCNIKREVERRISLKEET